MKKRILAWLLLIVVLINFTSCGSISDNSTFSIHFIDVGQGDSALVECDGRYMLIDGGDTIAGDKVYSVLEEQGIQELDILVASHFDADHIGGLTKALTYASKIGVTLSNSTYADKEVFRKFERQLTINGSSIKVPAKGDTYELGSATVKILDVSAEKENDSLVLLITYGNTRFLFTGDIERNGQLRVIEALQDDPDHRYGGEEEWVSLMKMPHHGAYNDKQGLAENALYRLLWEYNPSYIVISVGVNNSYKHPHQQTMDMIEDLIVKSKELDWDSHVYRTDKDGDIIVRSDGEKIQIDTLR